MSTNDPCCGKKVHKCGSKLNCKSTAALEAQVSEEMELKDKPLEEILNVAQDKEISDQ